MAHQAEKIGSEKARGGNIALTIQLVLCGKQFLNYCLTDKQAHFLKTNSFLNITLTLAYFYRISFLAFLNYVVGRTSRPISSGTLTLTGHLVFLDFWISQQFFGLWTSCGSQFARGHELTYSHRTWGPAPAAVPCPCLSALMGPEKGQTLGEYFPLLSYIVIVIIYGSEQSGNEFYGGVCPNFPC